MKRASGDRACSRGRREVPREQLLLIIRSFGGTVAWDGEGSPHTEADEAITHQACSCAKHAGPIAV